MTDNLPKIGCVQHDCQECKDRERQSVPAGWYITKAEAMADAEEQAIALAAAPQPEPVRCTYCDGTGDVHSITGEWRGSCGCEAGKAQPQPAQQAISEIPNSWFPGLAEKTRQEAWRIYQTSPQAPQPQAETQAYALNTLCKMLHSGEEVEGDDGLAMLVPMDLWSEAQEAIELLIGEGDGTEAAHGITKGTT